MTDPRTQPGYKQKHGQERVELLLGAILDELIKANAARPAKTTEEAPAVRVRIKKDN